MQILSAEYEKILAQSSDLLADEKDLIANAANLSALLFESLDAVDWVGVYFLRDGELVLGPFQGRAVKSRLPLGRSAAGRVVRDLRSLITEGRTADESDDDHLSQAQVIVPILMHDRCVGVFEIDSPFGGRFNDHDRAGLEAAARLLIDSSDTRPLLPRRTSISELRPAGSPPPPTGTTARERLVADPEAARERRVATYRVEDPLPLPSDEYERSDFDLRSRLRKLPVLLVAIVVLVIAGRSALQAPQSVAAALGHALLALLAFLALGTAISATWRMQLRKIAVVTGVYAIALAIMQAVMGSQTSLAGHVGDIITALIGGYIGGAIGRALRRRWTYRQRVAE